MNSRHSTVFSQTPVRWRVLSITTRYYIIGCTYVCTTITIGRIEPFCLSTLTCSKSPLLVNSTETSRCDYPLPITTNLCSITQILWERAMNNHYLHCTQYILWLIMEWYKIKMLILTSPMLSGVRSTTIQYAMSRPFKLVQHHSIPFSPLYFRCRSKLSLPGIFKRV